MVVCTVVVSLSVSLPSLIRNPLSWHATNGSVIRIEASSTGFTFPTAEMERWNNEYGSEQRVSEYGF